MADSFGSVLGSFFCPASIMLAISVPSLSSLSLHFHFNFHWKKGNFFCRIAISIWMGDGYDLTKDNVLFVGANSRICYHHVWAWTAACTTLPKNCRKSENQPDNVNLWWLSIGLSCVPGKCQELDVVHDNLRLTFSLLQESI